VRCTQKADRVLYATLSRDHDELIIKFRLSFVASKAERLRIVDSVVENGRGAEGASVVHLRVWHCAGAHMHSGGAVMSRTTPTTCNRNRKQRGGWPRGFAESSGLAARRCLAMGSGERAEQWRAVGRPSRGEAVGW
jgi:hypothetical protein